VANTRKTKFWLKDFELSHDADVSLSIVYILAGTKDIKLCARHNGDNLTANEEMLRKTTQLKIINLFSIERR